MKIVKEFSRFAHEYKKRNIIQSEVAKKLVSLLEKKRYPKILDLGAGSGAVYQNMEEEEISFEKFDAFDFSEEMLLLHPSDDKIHKICSDFNSMESFSTYTDNEFSLLISASALQWSENLFLLLRSISRLAPEHYFAFFTSKTFSTLHETAGIISPIYSKNNIFSALEGYDILYMEEVNYQLKFNSVREMFKYIKRSGVSGGSGKLSYSQMKKLMNDYPLDYLEFEVLFIKAKCQ